MSCAGLEDGNELLRGDAKISMNYYLMESGDETVRLELKTDTDALKKQADWCGIKPGMRVLDVACGPGKTTDILYEMIQPGGSIVGIDISQERIAYAIDHYGNREGVEFCVHDITMPMDELGRFDMIWVRFVLEYFRKESPRIVKNLFDVLNPGGYLCLIDLDLNCLCHYELPPRMAQFLPKLMDYLDREFNFDTYAGRKLYSYLFDQKFEDIVVNLMPHHLIYGNLQDRDSFNWEKKVEVVVNSFKGIFDDYIGGYRAFHADFEHFFQNSRRFTYTPLILCKGKKPTTP